MSSKPAYYKDQAAHSSFSVRDLRLSSFVASKSGGSFLMHLRARCERLAAVLSLGGEPQKGGC